MLFLLTCNQKEIIEFDITINIDDSETPLIISSEIDNPEVVKQIVFFLNNEEWVTTYADSINTLENVTIPFFPAPGLNKETFTFFAEATAINDSTVQSKVIELEITTPTSTSLNGLIEFVDLYE